jgi:hypothetical protein
MVTATADPNNRSEGYMWLLPNSALTESKNESASLHDNKYTLCGNVKAECKMMVAFDRYGMAHEPQAGEKG